MEYLRKCKFSKKSKNPDMKLKKKKKENTQILKVLYLEY